MATEEILLKYKADITDLQAKITKIETEIRKTGKAADDSQKAIKKSFDETGKSAGVFTNQLQNLGRTIIAAFAVERVLAFGKASFNAFVESEKAETRLLVALEGREDVQKRLLIQAKELQAATGIQDEAIVAQQTFLATQNRTEAQIRKTIQAAVELSKVTGESLDEAVRKLDGTYEGVIGRLGKLDSGFKDLTQEQLANGAAVDLVLEKYSGFAEQSTQNTAGALDKLAASFDDLQETVGKLLNKGGGVITFLDDLFKGLSRFFTSNFDATVQNNIELTTKATDAFIKSFEEFRKTAREGGDVRSDFELASVLIRENNESIQQANKELSQAISKDEQARLRQRIIILDAEKKALLSFLEGEKIARENAANAGLDAAKKAAEAAAKTEAERQKIAEESKEKLRAFVLKSLDDNAKLESDQRKLIANQTIKDAKSLDAELVKIDLETLEQLRDNRIQLSEDTTEIDRAIVQKQIEQLQLLRKLDKEAAQKALKDIEDNAKAKIEVLSRVKDDPTTKVNEEAKAQKDILSLRKTSVNAQTLLLEELRKSGILTEEEYTNEVKRLAQDRKLIKADEDAFVLENDTKTKEEQLENLRKFFDDAKEISEAFGALGIQLLQNQIDGLEAQRTAQDEAFNKEQEAIESNANKRLITEGQAEKQSADLKKKRAESEKKSNDEVNKLKRRQAEIDKALSLFRIGLILAEAIADVNIPKIISATLELAVVAATPIPKFHKGQKAKTSQGEKLAIVREDEDIFSPEVSREYHETFNAIHDKKITSVELNNFVNTRKRIAYENEIDKYVMKFQVTHILKEQQKKHEAEKQKSFAENVGKSVVYNGLSFYDMDYIMRKRAKPLDEKSFAKALSKEIVRALRYES